jgi:hypothetical protein
VRETFAALLAHHQARAAGLRAVRASMARIALDETRHAALSFAVADFLDGRLDAAARRRVREARAAAAAALLREMEDAPLATLRQAVGLPDTDVTQTLVRALDAALWH